MISNKRNHVCSLIFFFFRTKAGSLTCVWWVSLTERLQTVAVSLQKPTIIWLFQDLGKLPSQLAEHRLNHKAAVILACVASVSNRVVARKLEQEQKKGVPSPFPVIPFLFCSRPNFLDELARKRLLRRLQWFKKTNIYIQVNLREMKVARKGIQFSLIRTLLSDPRTESHVQRD